MAEDNTVYIGNKTFMNYVTSVLMQFNRGSNEVNIKARGKHISRAVDIAEMVRNKFVTDAKVKSIEIASEEFQGKDGKNRKVSVISISLAK